MPTKNRPLSVKTLLESLANQTQKPGRILIIASGVDIYEVVTKFQEDLQIDYFHTNLSGQIRQRNIGIKKLDVRTSLVACIDDDIVLSSTAIVNMVSFWNTVPNETAGVGFTITNGPKPTVSLVHEILGLDSRTPGRVLRTGMSSGITHLNDSIQTEWLNGGTTVWRQEILISHPHQEIDSPWAIAEDLIFSYPIGKKYPLFVCANATVEHLELKINQRSSRWHYNHGLIQTVWLNHFVKHNKNLSQKLFILVLIARILFKMINGIFLLNKGKIFDASGMTAGLALITGNKIFGNRYADLRSLINKL